MLHTPHTHHLSYIIKQDNEGNLVGRLLQLPEVIVQGNSEDEIYGKIFKTTSKYITSFKEEEHKRLLDDETPKLGDAGSGFGTIVSTKELRIVC